MNKFFKNNLIVPILWFCAKRVVKRHKPEVVAITGSLGKSTAKALIGEVLVAKFGKENVLVSEASYNTEIGIPLVVLGIHVPGNTHSITGWLGVVLAALKKSFTSSFPKYVVLEAGADKPGDIEFITKRIKPKIAVVTAVSKTHLSEFKTEKGVTEEKLKLVSTLPKEGVAILNADDKNVAKMADSIIARIITFGKSAKASVHLRNLHASRAGLHFEVREGETSQTFSNKNFIAPYNTYAFLAAISVGLAYGIGLDEMETALKSAKPLPGRMNPIAGIKGAEILDDSYNSSPKAAAEALGVLESLGKGKRKIAVLGQMNELGKASKKEHEALGKLAAKKADLLLTVGPDANEYLAKAAVLGGMKKTNMFEFADADLAGKKLKSIISPGDIILFKGSQNNVRLEKAVKEVMADPQKASELLCRQGEEWEN